MPKARCRVSVRIAVATLAVMLLLSGCGGKAPSRGDATGPEGDAAAPVTQSPAGMQRAADSASQAVDQLNAQTGQSVDGAQ